MPDWNIGQPHYIDSADSLAFQAERCYREHPRFAVLTDYLMGLVWSGAFTPDEMAGAALLAGRLAEGKRKEIPARRTATVTECQSPKKDPTTTAGT